MFFLWTSFITLILWLFNGLSKYIQCVFILYLYESHVFNFEYSTLNDVCDEILPFTQRMPEVPMYLNKLVFIICCNRKCTHWVLVGYFSKRVVRKDRIGILFSDIGRKHGFTLDWILSGNGYFMILYLNRSYLDGRKK